MLVDEIRADLVAAGSPPTPAAVAAAVRRRGSLMGDVDVAELVRGLRSELVGLGPLEPLILSGDVSDVLVNGPDDVWVDRGEGLVPAGVRFTSESEVRRLAQRLAVAAGRRLDEAVPFVDARLVSGLRLHAVLPPVSGAGTLLSIRVPAGRSFDLTGLVRAGSLPAWGARWLRAIISARLAFLVSGGTGSGKTTVLAALLGEVGPAQRIVLVEDSGELLPRHPHVVRLQGRTANVEGTGHIGLSELVRQALRMRPDRLVVGEVRGAEVVDLLAALNTGHEGSCATVHANSARHVPARLEALATAAGLERGALHSQLAAGVDVVIHLARDLSGQRRVEGVGVLTRRSDGLVEVMPALNFHPTAAPGPAGGDSTPTEQAASASAAECARGLVLGELTPGAAGRAGIHERAAGPGLPGLLARLSAEAPPVVADAPHSSVATQCR